MHEQTDIVKLSTIQYTTKKNSQNVATHSFTWNLVECFLSKFRLSLALNQLTGAHRRRLFIFTQYNSKVYATSLVRMSVQIHNNSLNHRRILKRSLQQPTTTIARNSPQLRLAQETTRSWDTMVHNWLVTFDVIYQTLHRLLYVRIWESFASYVFEFFLAGKGIAFPLKKIVLIV